MVESTKQSPGIRRLRESRAAIFLLAALSTADAVPAIIANLRGRGFHLVTISTLLRAEDSAH